VKTTGKAIMAFKYQRLHTMERIAEWLEETVKPGHPFKATEVRQALSISSDMLQEALKELHWNGTVERRLNGWTYRVPFSASLSLSRDRDRTSPKKRKSSPPKPEQEEMKTPTFTTETLAWFRECPHWGVHGLYETPICPRCKERSPDLFPLPD